MSISNPWQTTYDADRDDKVCHYAESQNSVMGDVATNKQHRKTEDEPREA